MSFRPRRLTAAVVSSATLALSVAGVPFAGSASAAANVSCTATPEAGVNNATPTTVTATASPGSYLSGDHIRLKPTFVGGLPLNGAGESDPTHLSAGQVGAPMNLSGAAPGIYDVQVIRDVPDPSVPMSTDTIVSSSCTTLRTAAPAGKFNIAASGSPAITTLSITQRAAGSPATPLTINGSNFAQGATISFFTAATSVADGAISFTTTSITASAITGTLTVGSGAVSGQHFVRVTNTDTQSGASSCPGAGCLTVNAAPTISTVAPADNVAPNGVAAGASRQFRVVGTGFTSGFTATVLNPSTTTADPQASVTAASLISPAEVLVTIAETGTAVVGPRDLRITNADGGSAIKSSAFTVDANPTVSGVSPASYDQGTTGKKITVTGTGFLAGAVASFPGSSGVTVTDTTVSSGTSIVVTVDTTAGATPGFKVMTITNPDRGTATTGSAAGPTAYSVTAKPTVTGVSPPSAARGTHVVMTVTGTSFSTDAQVSISGDGITNGVTTYNSATSLSYAFDLGSGAAQSQRDVTVTNGDPAGTSTSRGGVGTKTNAFAVSAIGVTGATPSSSGNGPGASSVQLTISGSGFDTGPTAPTVSLVAVGAPAYQPDIVATAVSVSSASSLSATFNLVGAAPGMYAIKVVNANGDTGSCASCFQVVGSTPTVTSVNPASRGSGAQNQTLKVMGTNFARGAVVTFGGGVTIVGQPTFVSPTEVDVVANIPSGISVATPVSVTVRNVDAAQATCATTCFTINPAPVVTTLTPASRAAGAAGTKSVTMSGSGFQPGATVVFSGDDILVTGISVAGDGNSITFNISTATSAAGTRSVTVTNPDAGTATKASAFTVDPQPTVTGITPNRGATGQTGQAVTITGTGFLSTPSNPTISLGSNIVVTNIVVAGNGQSMTATLDLTGAATGLRNLTVTNADDGSATLSNAYTVVSSPTVASASPSSLGQGATTRTVTLTGTGFVSGATVTVSGGGVTAGTATVTSPTSLSVPLTVDPAAATSARDVTVTNPDTGNGRCTGCFTVNAKPVVTSVAPNKVATGVASTNITVTGSGFVSPATLSLGAGVSVSNVVVASPTSITATISTTGAAVGPRDVTVTNPDGGVGVLAAGFTVISTPTITSIAPSSLAQGATTAPVTITGTNFTAGSGTQPTPTVNLGPGITVADVSATATTITFTATVAPTAATGLRAISVTNPDTGTVTRSDLFTVDPKVTITSIDPTQLQQGRTAATITVTGTGFQPGAVTATFSGTGVTVTNANAASATSVTLTVNVAGNATLGDRDLTVTNPGNRGTATCLGCLKVVAARPFTVLVDTTTPESGSTHNVTVTAKQSNDPSAATDTTYTGTPVLSSTDTHFTPGTCGAAVSGVANCTGVVFGDLGPKVLTALGQGGDSDRGGTVNVVVDAVSLQFVSPPTTGRAGQPVSFTVRPVAGVTGATITAYAKPRTVYTTGGTSSPASGATLTCGAASCAFTVTWSSGGTKTVRVSDGHASTPYAVVTLPVSSTLSSRLSRSVCIYGDTVVLSGSLVGAGGQAGAGAIIAIYARTAPAASMTLLRNVRADADGNWSTGLRMPRNSVFQARFAGNAQLDPATGPAKALSVRTKVSVTTRPTTVVHGKAFTIKGVVGPPVGGLLVTLQYFGTDRAWHTVASSRTVSNGAWAITASRGVSVSNRYYRVIVERSATNVAGSSSVFKINAT